jgi:pilus assembly protein CpaC
MGLIGICRAAGMPRRLGAAVLAAGVYLGLGLAAEAPWARAEAAARTVELSQNESRHIRIPKGKSVTVHTDASFSDIVVGDPETATVAPLTDRSLYIIGIRTGATSVALFDGDKRLIGELEIEISYDTDRLARELGQNIDGARIKVSSINGSILLSGTAPDGVAVDKAMSIAEEYGGKHVVNQISVGRPQQVLLEVRFLEASRNASKELGVNWDVIGNGWSLASGAAALIRGFPPFGTAVGTLLESGVSAEAIIRALETRGLARRLAEPNLVALSGDTAEFLAGGEFPFPVQAEQNRVTLEFKKFGVGLAFTPTVVGDGLINLKIEPEVSQLDTTTAIKLSGIEIPSLIVRRASTTVELRDGQSFVIAGLLQSNTTTAREQLPWIGDVPVLGALFRSAAYRRNETDLAIIVTPRLVVPAAPGDILNSPLDATMAANDHDYFLYGMDEVKTAYVHWWRLDNQYRPFAGHILDVARRRRGK